MPEVVVLKVASLDDPSWFKSMADERRQLRDGHRSARREIEERHGVAPIAPRARRDEAAVDGGDHTLSVAR